MASWSVLRSTTETAGAQAAKRNWLHLGCRAKCAVGIASSQVSLKGADHESTPVIESMLGCVQANQWLVAKSGGLEVIACAMRGWREYPMVQLCALLCMVPLALDNTVLQVRTAAVVTALVWG